MTENTASRRPMWSWDGKGINGPDEYRRRLFTARDADDREDAGAIDKAGILAAAAPDMLAALEDTRAAIVWALDKDADHEQTLVGLSLQLDAIRAAIAKATGDAS